jgi:hypothetical protein
LRISGAGPAVAPVVADPAAPPATAGENNGGATPVSGGTTTVGGNNTGAGGKPPGDGIEVAPCQATGTCGGEPPPASYTSL